MFVVCGLLTALVAAFGYAVPRIRHLERDLPDHIDV
jgi:hypothetical protein